jgi:hypothetical protein
MYSLYCSIAQCTPVSVLEFYDDEFFVPFLLRSIKEFFFPVGIEFPIAWWWWWWYRAVTLAMMDESPAAISPINSGIYPHSLVNAGGGHVITHKFIPYLLSALPQTDIRPFFSFEHYLMLVDFS